MREIRSPRRARAAAIFTDEEVRAIRRADEVGLVSRLEQARTYGVGKETIARICRGETYYWVAQEDELTNDPVGVEPPRDVQDAAREGLLAAIRLQNSLRPDNLLDELAVPAAKEE